MENTKLFDDSIYIDERVSTKNDARRWLYHFQKYCDSDAMREESSRTGLNACGYGIQCDFCPGSEKKDACARAMRDYCRSKNISINFRNTSAEYFERMLRGELQ